MQALVTAANCHPPAANYFTRNSALRAVFAVLGGFCLMPRTLLAALLLLFISAPMWAQDDRPVLVKRAPDGSTVPVSPPPSENPPPYNNPAPNSAPAPYSAPATYNPSAPYNMLAAGTSFLVRLDDTLDTARLSQGKHFKAKLAEDLLGPSGAVLIPR